MEQNKEQNKEQNTEQIAPKEKSRQELIADSLREHELKGPDYLTYVARPILADDINTWSDLSPDGGAGTAIILAGPMVYENHFTYDTIRLYRKHYPEALIILSTWADQEAKDYLKDVQDDKTLIELSERTDEQDDIQYRNQVHTALQTASEWGVTHVLSTSSQHRLYAPNLIDYFKGIQKTFPLPADHPQKKRIITSNHVAAKYIPYHINAAVMFGHMHDMLNYWAAPNDGHPQLPPVDRTASVIERSKIDPGCYYTRSYLERIGVEFNPESLRDSWRIMAEQFCFVDCQTIDLFWRIPNTKNEKRSIDYGMRGTKRWTFQDWLTLWAFRDRTDLPSELNLNMPASDEINSYVP